MIFNNFPVIFTYFEKIKAEVKITKTPLNTPGCYQNRLGRNAAAFELLAQSIF